MAVRPFSLIRRYGLADPAFAFSRKAREGKLNEELFEGPNACHHQRNLWPRNS